MFPAEKARALIALARPNTAPPARRRDHHSESWRPTPSLPLIKGERPKVQTYRDREFRLRSAAGPFRQIQQFWKTAFGDSGRRCNLAKSPVNSGLVAENQ